MFDYILYKDGEWDIKKAPTARQYYNRCPKNVIRHPSLAGQPFVG